MGNKLNRLLTIYLLFLGDTEINSVEAEVLGLEEYQVISSITVEVVLEELLITPQVYLMHFLCLPEPCNSRRRTTVVSLIVVTATTVCRNESSDYQGLLFLFGGEII